MKLGNIANISTGLVLNRKTAIIESDIKKKYKVLSLLSVAESGWINQSLLEDFHSNEILKDKYTTKSNDIVIRLSSPYTCILITNETEGLLVPSQFSIIRVSSEDIVPGYIAYILDAEPTKQDYFRTSLGATIPVIRVSQLRDTEIPMVEINKQKAIGEYRSLMIKELLLHHQLIELVNKKNKQIEIRLMEGMKNDN